mgnify:CR=1 FL=1|jgi:hypothetical protein
METNDYEKYMNETLRRLGLGYWSVYWLPDLSSSVRGRVLPKKMLIEIFDVDIDEAWKTFFHEVIEIKLRSTLRPYRLLVNSLIGIIEEITDNEKDIFIESLTDLIKPANLARQE